MEDGLPGLFGSARRLFSNDFGLDGELKELLILILHSI